MAGSSAGSIFVDLLLRDGAYKQGLQNSARYTSNATREISRNFKNVLNPLNAVNTAIVQLGVVTASALSVKSIINYSDQWRKLEGRLNLVSDSSTDLADTQEKLFRIAQNTRTDFGATVTLYQRLTSATQDLGVSQTRVLNFTEQFNKILITAGLTSEEARASILQLTQAFNKGKLDGDEFRTILESAPPVLEALSKHLNKTKGDILDMAKAGQLTPKILLDSINAMADTTDKRFEGFSQTVGQAFTQLDNAFLKYIGQNDKIHTSTEGLAKGISYLADNFDNVAAAVETVAVVISTRLTASVISYTSAQGLMLVGMLRVQFALAEMEGLSIAAAGGLLTLRGATLALGAAFRVFLPAVAILAIYELLDGNESLIETEKKLGEEVERTASKLDDTFKIHGALTKEAIDEVKKRIEAYKTEKEYLNSILRAATDDTGEFSRLQKLKDLVGEVGEGISNFIGGNFKYTSVEEAIKLQEDYAESVKKLNNLLDKKRVKEKDDPIDDVSKHYLSVVRNAEKWIVKEKELTKTLAMEKDYIGLTTVEIDKLKDAREIDTQIAERSIELKGKERVEFLKNAEALKNLRQEIIETNYEASRTAQAGASDFFTHYVEDATNAAENVKNVLQDAFKGAEDAFVEFTKTGKLNFRDMASSIVEDLIRIQFRQSIASLIGLATGSNFGSLFDSQGSISRTITGTPYGPVLPAFADGGYLGPGQFGVAGEAGAELLYGGKAGVSVFNQDQMGGKKNVYNIDARGADQSAVQRMQAALLALAGPGVIERRVTIAQQRGSL